MFYPKSRVADQLPLWQRLKCKHRLVGSDEFIHQMKVFRNLAVGLTKPIPPSIGYIWDDDGKHSCHCVKCGHQDRTFHITIMKREAVKVAEEYWNEFKKLPKRERERVIDGQTNSRAVWRPC